MDEKHVDCGQIIAIFLLCNEVTLCARNLRILFSWKGFHVNHVRNIEVINYLSIDQPSVIFNLCELQLQIDVLVEGDPFL